MANATNIEVGVCEVTFGGTSLGHTKGGVTFTYEVDFYDITTDQYGTGAIVDKTINGERMMLTVPMSEYTLDNLAIAMPFGDNTTATRIDIGSDAGQKLSQFADVLVAHPIERLSTNRERDIVFHKAAVMEVGEISFSPEGERIVEVTFIALVDESQNENVYLGLIGDSTT